MEIQQVEKIVEVPMVQAVEQREMLAGQESRRHPVSLRKDTLGASGEGTEHWDQLTWVAQLELLEATAEQQRQPKGEQAGRAAKKKGKWKDHCKCSWRVVCSVFVAG